MRQVYLSSRDLMLQVAAEKQQHNNSNVFTFDCSPLYILGRPGKKKLDHFRN